MGEGMMSVKTAWATWPAITIAFMLTGLLSLLGFFQSPAFATEKIVLQLRWDYQFQFAGYIAADMMGYYEAEGLDVDIRSAIKPDKSIVSAIGEVEEGRAQFGIGGADILIARDKGAPLVVLASIFQNSASAFYALKDTEINNLADFTQLKVARRVNDLIDVELQAMLRSEGIDIKQVKPHKHQAGYEHLLDGRVDVMPGYRISFPFELRVAEIDIRSVTPSQYGVGFYGDSLFTTEELVSNEPEMVDAFLRASIKGWQYALEHPEEIADRISEELPRSAYLKDIQGFNRFQIQGVTDLAMFPVVKIGHINPQRWAMMHRHLQKSGLVARPLDLSQFIYDPGRAKAKREFRVYASLIGLATALFIITLTTFVWVRLLRRVVASKTESLTDEISRHKETAHNLVQSVDLLESIFEQAAVGMAQLELDGRWIKANQRLCDIVGYTYEEMMELTFQDITYPDDLEADLAFVQELLDGKRDSYSMEKRYYRKDGSIIWINLTGSVARDENRNPLYFIAIIENITERKHTQLELAKAQQDLAQSLGLFESIFEQVAVGMAQVRLDGQWMKVNQRLCEIAGYTRAEMLGLTFQDITHPDDLETDLVYVQELLDGKRDSYSMEKRYIRKDGSTIWVYITPAVVRDENNNPMYFASVIEDINEKKIIQQELVETEKRLALAHKLESVGQLASGIAHEINTPLQYIQGNLTFLRNSFNEIGDAKTTSANTFIETVGELVDELKPAVVDSIDGVSQISRIVQAMKRIAHPDINSVKAIDLNELIRNIVIVATNEWKYVATVDLELDTKNSLVMCDPGEINQVLLNILVNAAHSIAEKVQGTSEKGVIKVSTRYEDAFAVIAIKDTGTGIPIENRDRIYDQFFTTKEVGKGTGQGLAITHSIINKHGGSIDLESQEGIGTTFIITFPLSGPK